MYSSTHAATAVARNKPLSKLFQHGLATVAVLFMGLSTSLAMAQDLLISGVIDGPLTGGVPKAVEIYVINTTADLSNCGIGSAQNGGGTDGEEFTFPAVGAVAGNYIYLASEAVEFNNFFGFSPDYTDSFALINGDDAIELFCDGMVVDTFGDINTDGTGQPWEYLDGWAYRVNSTGPDGAVFTIANWTFSGPNALDGETSNATASTPFPLGSFIGGGVSESAPVVVSSSPASSATGVAIDSDIVINFSEDVTVGASGFDVNCASSGDHSFGLSGGPLVFTLDPDVDFVYSEECTVSVLAAEVTDVDTDDPPDNMDADHVFNFTVEAPPVISPMLINEVDADTPGTDTAEFVELFDGGTGNTPLDGLVLVMFNGSDDASYYAFDLDGQVTDASGYFVLCGNAANVGNCDMDVSPSSNLVQNGADAVALFLGDAASFPNDTPVTTDYLIDALVYDTSDGDDAGLLPLLNAGQPQVNEGGAGDKDNHSNQRCPNGAGGGRNTEYFAQTKPTPGVANDCVLINEVDADTPGNDVAEFVELYSPGGGDFALDGYSLVFYNGSDDKSYYAFDLDGQVTDAEGYFVLCGDAGNVTTCDLDVSPNSNLIQNGADAVALIYGNAADYPNDTPLSTVGLVDAIVYDTNDSDNAVLLTLLNPGQPQVNEGGAGDKDNHSNQRCLNGFGGARNTETYEQALPTPGASNECGPVEIFTIQGVGAASLYDGYEVETVDNIVTAVGERGFFMQTPSARSDGNVDTSDGIYVYTGSAPAVAVGDSVDVTGMVDEYFEFTEFTGSPVIVVNSSGNALPSAVAFNASVPSPNPVSASCAIEFECYEGMLVEIASGRVNSGNQRFGSDPIAEVLITAAGSRSYREPGLEYPGVGGSIPTWDGNPEVFEMDPDALGLSNQVIFGGSNFSATGILSFEFGGYELWPVALAVAQPPLPMAVRARMPGETTVGSLNLYRPTEDDKDTRFAKLSVYIRETLLAPDVLAVQEIASQASLQELADVIAADDSSVQYTAYVIEGNDVGGIDVGFLVRTNISVEAVTQLGADEIFYYDASLLHDRPPLLLEGKYMANGVAFPLAVMVVHNRSLNGIETERVQLKRLTQAESIAAKVQAFQAASPDVPLMVVGDFNAFEFTDGYVDAVGHIKGVFNPAESIQSGLDLVSPDMTNQVDLLDPAERYSFIYQGNAQALDHALTNDTASYWARGMAFGRGNADAAVDQINQDPDADDFTGFTGLRSSDHDGLVVFMMTDFDGDGYADDLDGCPTNQYASVPHPERGCDVSIPTLNPAGMALLFLLLSGLGVYTVRYRGVSKAR